LECLLRVLGEVGSEHYVPVLRHPITPMVFYSHPARPDIRAIPGANFLRPGLFP
jgi:hypothetical protein